jgi:pimeloyl-ACP methyl ester carboxylesterase
VQRQHQILPVKRHGPRGRTVLVLHGGPGAPGSAGLLARALADPLHVLEPWQRTSSDTPLTVAQHIEDLAAAVSHESSSEKPALVGESWGAMLALAFTAAYPDRISALGLVGCGTFDRRSRAELHRTLEERTTPDLREQLAKLAERVTDENERMARAHALSDHLYTFSRAVDDHVARVDLKGHTESWNDMVRLQYADVYPAAFVSITCPVLMLHGSYDPHPGGLIRDSLREFIPHLEYIELDRCGHSPWVEEHARDRFLSILRSWLERHLE